MRGVRVVGVGPTLTAAIPGDSPVRVFPDVTYWHREGELHRLVVRGDAVVDTRVQRGTHDYLAGMELFATDGD